MMTVIDANLLPIIIAVVIGFIIGFWMFRRARSSGSRTALDRKTRSDQIEAPPGEPPPPPVRPYMRSRPIRDGIDTVEGRGVADEGAAAVRNVAGEVLGVSPVVPAATGDGPEDDLQMLKGVGPKLAQRLKENGITRFEQLAQLSPNEVTIMDAKLGPFKGRLERDRIVEQASYLARGDRDGFEARFGKLGSG